MWKEFWQPTTFPTGPCLNDSWWIFRNIFIQLVSDDPFCILTLKAPRKNSSEKWRLLKSSAANNCQTLLSNLSIEANRVDPDQTAPIEAVWSGSTLFVIEASYTFQQMRKADDFCFDRHFKGSQAKISKVLCIYIPGDCFQPSKQCRHRWNAALCGISSGSSLFVKVPV